MPEGFAYQVAIMDCFSRYVIAWELSNSMESSFCRERFRAGPIPEASSGDSHTDQGSQFTSAEWLRVWQGRNIRVSPDERRAFDNIFIERLWHTVKWEHVFLHERRTLRELRGGLKDYFEYYNQKRWHSALENQPLAAVNEG